MYSQTCPNLFMKYLMNKFSTSCLVDICITAKENTLQEQGVSCSHVEFKFNWCQSGVKPPFSNTPKARKHRIYKGFTCLKASSSGTAKHRESRDCLSAA